MISRSRPGLRSIPSCNSSKTTSPISSGRGAISTHGTCSTQTAGASCKALSTGIKSKALYSAS